MRKEKIKKILKNLGYSRSYIYKLIKGIKFPSCETLKKLYIASNGEITPNDMYPLNEWREELRR